MKITLPPRLSGQPLELDTDRNSNIVIIGANGSGKTRFAARMAADAEGNAFRLSALKALYDRDRQDPTPGSIDCLYHEATRGASIMRPDLKGEFERMIALMINEEMLSLIDYKFRRLTDRLPATRLEQVIRRFERVFPDNKVLIESGRMLFSRDDTDDAWSPAKLSDGEKAVMYYLGAVTFAPRGSLVFVDSPGMFLHPSSIRSVWDEVERMRPDCTFVYVTHDLQFASTRTGGQAIWVKSCDPGAGAWDYDFLSESDGLTDEAVMAILGARKPVLFIEGDGINSIDARLYPLIFNDYTVKSLGGCDRVIESTRTFNSLRSFHNLEAFGIVDRDRRDDGEVEYLRRKQVFVPEVAEIENLFMLEDVVSAMAHAGHKNPQEVVDRVKRTILRLFDGELRLQALQHTRHRVKKAVEHRIDGRFANIGQLEVHISQLADEINPRGIYEQLCRDFRRYIHDKDYASVLRVYNRKTMISESHVSRLCGLRHDSMDAYIGAVLDLLRRDRPEAATIRQAVRHAFNLE
ncbi:MAG: DUF4435 domain-containing protein [Muribaculaceae bacterium]|nr:DUF4435 domain-containing protein [Muribaculaceae bacterium]